MKKTQIGWIVLAAAAVAIGITVFQKVNTITLVYICVGMALLVILFGTLTVTVTDEHVKFSFGIGIIRGKYEIKEITSCRMTSYIPMGWGIRFRPGVTLFNVSGYKAFEIKRKGKRDIWIGTNCPEEFIIFINKKMDSLKKTSSEV
jgi:hypothetical protein